MARAIIDIVFSVVILIAICIRYFYTGEMTVGEFYIALMLNYFGARYLLMSNIDYAFYEATVESEDRDE